MEQLEDGELGSSPEQQDSDPETAPYTPLIRPEVASATRPRSATNCSMVAHAGDLDNRDWDVSCSSNVNQMSGRGKSNSTTSDSSSASVESDDDSEDGFPRSGTKKKKKKRKSSSGKPSRPPSSSHGDAFTAMAKEFQERRRSSSNNVWGSILQEDSLNSDLNAIGVGRKSIKDLASDRGAEAYDYTLAAKEELLKSGEPPNRGRRMDSADAMDTGVGERRHFANIQAGKKRSVKDRLGQRREEDCSPLEDLSIPQPGVPRQIPDISPEVIEQIRRHLEVPSGAKKGSSSESDDAEGEEDERHIVLGEELANRLCEPKTELMVGILGVIGVDVALEVFGKTRLIEAEGGMMIKNGARRRTPGGVFLHLVREVGADPSDGRVDGRLVKEFFAQTNRDAHRARDGSKKGKNNDFLKDLAMFKKKSAKLKSTRNTVATTTNDDGMEDGDLKPLPDILSFVSKDLARQRGAEGASKNGSSFAATGRATASNKDPDAFVEPEAPPNSVERPINNYEDDFLAESVETEDIELF